MFVVDQVWLVAAGETVAVPLGSALDDEDIEDALDLAEARRVEKRARERGERPIPWAEVRARLDALDEGVAAKRDGLIRKDATARQIIHDIADEAAPALRDEILETLANAQGKGTLAAVEAALERGDVEGAIDAIGWDAIAADQLLELLPGHYTEIINAAARVASDAAAFDVSFTAVDEAAAQWAAEQAAARVTGISEATRDGLRSLISLGQTAGIPPRELAKLIREQVGLTEQGAQSLFNYRAGLEEAGRSVGDIERLVARQGERLLNARAELIARTETLSAGSAGQQISWERAVDEGNLPESAQRRWSADRSERTCPVCRAMHGKVVGLREPWVLPDGREAMIPQDAHPG